MQRDWNQQKSTEEALKTNLCYLLTLARWYVRRPTTSTPTLSLLPQVMIVSAQGRVLVTLNFHVSTGFSRYCRRSYRWGWYKSSCVLLTGGHQTWQLLIYYAQLSASHTLIEIYFLGILRAFWEAETIENPADVDVYLQDASRSKSFQSAPFSFTD